MINVDNRSVRAQLERFLQSLGQSKSMALIAAVMVGIVGSVVLGLSFADTAKTVTATADTYVSSNYRVEHGTNQALKISGPGSDSTREAYVKFVVSGVANASNKTTITSAKLRFYVVRGNGDGGTLYKSANTSWAENMIYGQQPGTSGAVIASLNVKAGSWVDVPLPADMIRTDGTYSFTLKATAAEGVDYGSRESANKPQLVLTTASAQATPPPSSTGKTGYTLLWSDEFNGTALDTAKWNVYTGTLDYDQACYRKENVSVASGNLVIRSQYQPGVCGSAKSKWTGTNTPRSYTSGYIRTDAAGGGQDKYLVRPDAVASKVVRIEYRAQMPKNQKGVWPGLWSRNTQGSTTYGELDLLERFGDPRNAFSYDVTTHVGAGRHTGGDSGSVSNWTCPSTALRMNCLYNVESAMNVYAVEIDLPKSEVRYYLNDQLVVRHNPSTKPGFTKATWDRVMNDAWDLRLMTQIVHQNDKYHPEPDSTFSATELKVDYARVYAKN